ncbi:hypothetical protein PMIN03_012445 [Paraphaeosphaeria minitans]
MYKIHEQSLISHHHQDHHLLQPLPGTIHIQTTTNTRSNAAIMRISLITLATLMAAAYALNDAGPNADVDALALALAARGEPPKASATPDHKRHNHPHDGKHHDKATSKSGHAWKSEHTGRPEHTWKSEHTGRPEHTWKPEHTGRRGHAWKSGHTWKPEHTGRPEWKGKGKKGKQGEAKEHRD